MPEWLQSNCNDYETRYIALEPTPIIPFEKKNFFPTQAQRNEDEKRSQFNLIHLIVARQHKKLDRLSAQNGVVPSSESLPFLINIVWNSYFSATIMANNKEIKE